MSYQNILLPAIVCIAEHERIRQSVRFNETMADHYRQLYQRYRVGWNFISALYALKKWRYYEAQLHTIALTNQVNKKSNSYARSTTIYC